MSLRYSSGRFGNLFASEFNNNRIRKVDINGIITTVAGGGAGGGSDSGRRRRGHQCHLNGPTGVSADTVWQPIHCGLLNNRIRKVDTNGIITTVAGGGTAVEPMVWATAAQPPMPPCHAGSVALDPYGNLFIADNSNNRIRKVSTNGIITTVAGGGTGGGTDGLGDGGAATNASLNDPTFIAVDGSGNLFIADYYNNRVREVSTNGIITTVAGGGTGGGTDGLGDGGAATNAIVSLPIGAAVDGYGNLFICGGYGRVREVGANGIITTVAGNGSSTYSGDGGAATNAGIAPIGVSITSAETLFIADYYNGRIRKVALDGSPTFVLNNVALNNAGYYQVVVSSPYGSATSSVVSLTLTMVPPQTATATAVVAYGYFVAITNLDGGYGYTNTPIVRIVGGGGSGATAVAVVSNGVVTGIDVTATGSGYTNAPLVVIDPPFIPNPVLGIAPMSFLTFSNLTVGGAYQLQQSLAWYWTNRPVSFTATNSLYTHMVAGAWNNGNFRLALNPVPSQAFATPQVADGFVISATVTSGGSGYVTSPAVTIVGRSVVGAGAYSSISGGVVTGITVTNAGYGYTNTVTIQIAPPPAAAVFPTVLPVMRVDSSNLAPYDNYQIQFTPDITAGWINWNGGLFSPTAVTNSQFLFITNGVGFFRLQYVP